MPGVALFRLILFAIFIALITACASKVVVNVNAISDPQKTDYGKRYYLTNVKRDTPVNDLYFLEFRRYFDHILQKKGLVMSKSRDDADIEIQFQYGISDGRTARCSEHRMCPPIYSAWVALMKHVVTRSIIATPI